MAYPTKPAGTAADPPEAKDRVLNRLRGFLDRGPLGSPATRVWLFTILLASGALAGYLLSVRHLQPIPSPVHIPWPVLALACLAAETKVILVHFRRETHSFSLSEVPAVIGLFFVTPNEYLLAVLAGSGVALLVTARQSMVKIAFNLANFALIAVVTLAVFHSIATFAAQPGAVDWLAAFAAMLVAVVIGALTIATAISLSGGAPQFQKLPEMLKFGLVVAMANTSLALLAVSVMWINPSAVLLLLIPLVTIFLAYRAYLSEREKHEQLELLYQSSRILQHSPELDSALVALLDHARTMFRAEVAEVILYPRDESGDALRTTSIHDREPEAMVPERVELGAGIHGRISAERRAFFTTTAGRPLTGRTVRQAMVSPLIGESGLIGSMTVANRLTEGTSFDGEDLRLLETLANQAAVALENGQLEQSLAELSRLKEQLRHQAYHDPLTGLANRAMFAEQVDAQLAARQPGLDTVGPVPRPRRLQDRERHVGSRCRRPPPAGRCRAHQRLRSSRGPGRAAGWRRVRGAAPRHPEPRPLDVGRSADHRSPAGAVPDRRQRDRRWGEHRHRGHEPGTTTRPTCCCATPTSRCTRPRPQASVGRPCSSRRCTQRSLPVTRCRPSCRGAWGVASWPSSSSRSCGWPTGRWPASRRSSAGGTRRAV